MDVYVIGTEPACPRCDLPGRMVEEKQWSGIKLDIRHQAFDAPEAAEIAETYGKRSALPGKSLMQPELKSIGRPSMLK